MTIYTVYCILSLAGMLAKGMEMQLRALQIDTRQKKYGVYLPSGPNLE